MKNDSLPVVDDFWKGVLWRQFAAAIDGLRAALQKCPDEFWQARMWADPNMPAGFSEFWYIAYHALFWLDLYLGGAVEGFTPPAPFTLDELDPSGLLPGRVYSRAELLSYLDHCRGKAHGTIHAMSGEIASRVCKFSWGQLVFAELLLDNMRHVQEHAAQLNMFLGQRSGANASWVAGKAEH